MNIVLSVRGPYKVRKVRGWVTRRTPLRTVSLFIITRCITRQGAVLGRVTVTSIVCRVIIWTPLTSPEGVRGWDTALQAGKSRVRSTTGTFWFFTDLILPAYNRNEYQEYLPGGKDGQCVGLRTFLPCADCLEILAASTSWSPKRLSRDSFTLCLRASDFMICFLLEEGSLQNEEDARLCK